MPFAPTWLCLVPFLCISQVTLNLGLGSSIHAAPHRSMDQACLQITLSLGLRGRARPQRWATSLLSLAAAHTQAPNTHRKHILKALVAFPPALPALPADNKIDGAQSPKCSQTPRQEHEENQLRENSSLWTEHSSLPTLYEMLSGVELWGDYVTNTHERGWYLYKKGTQVIQ